MNIYKLLVLKCIHHMCSKDSCICTLVIGQRLLDGRTYGRMSTYTAAGYYIFDI